MEKRKLGNPAILQMDDNMYDDYAKRDELRPDEEPDMNIDVIQTSGIVLPHVLSNGLQELKDAALRHLNGSLLAIPTSTKPASDYDRRYFLKNYPNIFFYNPGERLPNASLPVYLDMLMKRPSTGAAQDFSFPFEARNVMIRHRTLRKVTLSLNLEHSSIIADISDKDLDHALQAIQNK